MLAVMMTMFMASLAGVPIFAGWFAKFVMFRSIIEAGTGWGIALGVIAARQLRDRVLLLLRPIRAPDVVRTSPPTDDRTPIRRPASRSPVAIALDGRGRGRRRRLPGAVRPDRGSVAF